MARYKSQFEPSGSLYGATFVKETDSRKAHVRQLSSLTRDKWRRAPEFAGARIAAAEFGGASKMAAEIYTALAGIKALCQPYTHNRIAKRVRQAARLQQTKKRGATKPGDRFKVFSAHHTAAALKGRQFGNDNGGGIYISGSNGHYTIHGLQQAHAAIQKQSPSANDKGCHGKQQSPSSLGKGWDGVGDGVQFRIHIAYVTISDLSIQQHDLSTAVPQYHFAGVPHVLSGRYLQPSAWINPDQLPTAEAYCQASDTLQLGQIDFPAHPATDNPAIAALRIITFVAIEWRLRHGRRTKSLKASSCVWAHEVLAFQQNAAVAIDTRSISHKPGSYRVRSRYRRLAHGFNPHTGLGKPVRLPQPDKALQFPMKRLPLRE